VRFEEFSLNNLADVLHLGLAMHQEGAYSTVEFDVQRTAYCIVEMVMKNPDGFGVLGYDKDGKAVAMMAGGVSSYFFSPKRKAYDHVWYVVPEHRGSRTAVLLLKRFVEWARSRGAGEIFVGVTTNIEPERTGKLLSRLGFKHVGGNYRLDV
jgi:GNAT superfamily N-acetyltransferase